MRQIKNLVRLLPLKLPRNCFLICLCLLLILYVFFSLNATLAGIGLWANAAYVVNIAIADNSYDRTDVTVTAGDTVIWKNNGGNPHTVTEDSGTWTSGTLATSQSFAFTFTQAGTYEYHCLFHPEMKGKIKVLPQANPTPTPAPSPASSPPSAVTTNTMPECVSLSGNPTIGGARLNVNFTGKGRDLDGIIRRLEFNFGDGETKTVDIANAGTNQDTTSSLSHTYRNPGTYNATLRVRDNSGQANEWSSISESCKVKIEVQGTVLGSVAATPSPTTTQVTTPPILPKAGVSEWLTISYFFTGIGGMLLKSIEKASRRDRV